MADLKKERDPFYDERDRFLVQVASNPKLSASAKSVAIVIALSHSNWKLFHKGEQWIAWPSIRTLVKSTGCKKRDTIIAAIRQLEEHGHLDVLRPETEGWGHNNKYRWIIKSDEKGPVEGTSLTDASKREKGPAHGTSVDEKGPAERTIEVPPTGPKSYEETYIGAGALTRPSPKSYDNNVSLNIDVVDKSDVLDLSLDDTDATEGMSGGQAFEKPSPALPHGSGHDASPASDDISSGAEPSPEPAPDYGTDWGDDDIGEPTDFEIAVGDLIRLIGDRDIALSLADDLVDGFAGHDHHLAMQAVKTAADCVDGLGVDFVALRDIVAEIGASAGRGASVGSEIAAKFSVELATHRRINSGAYQEGETCHV